MPKRFVAFMLAGAAAAVTGISIADYATAEMRGATPPTFISDTEIKVPEGYREWVFVGAPLTPNALNGGAAAFPEFHHTYIEPGAYAEFKKTGVFPEGTQMVKELVLLQPGEFPDGSRAESSGRGYFAAAPAGLDVSIKDSKRFAATNGWGYFNFGHHAPPYEATAKVQKAEACSGCHEANAATDMVYTQYYPILRNPK